MHTSQTTVYAIALGNPGENFHPIQVYGVWATGSCLRHVSWPQVSNAVEVIVNSDIVEIETFRHSWHMHAWVVRLSAVQLEDCLVDVTVADILSIGHGQATSCDTLSA